MAHIQLVKQTSSGLLLPATPESCDFLHQIKIGEWEHTPALSEAAEQYLNTVATRRTRDTALLKSFEAFREWVTIQAGFYTEHIYPDGSRGRRAKSIAFANMDEVEFRQVYKSVLNVLWNWILFRKFSSQEEVENVAAELLEFA